MSIIIGNVWSVYGFMNTRYPSPFIARERRWRTVEEFLEANGRDRETMLEANTLKFRSNPHLLNLLEETDTTPIVSDDDVLASVLVEVRSLLADKRGSSLSAFKRMMISLSQIVRENGFTTTLFGGSPILLEDLEEGDYIIELSGNGKEGTLDIYLSSPITDNKIRSIVAPYKKDGLDKLYILIGHLSRGSVARSLSQLSLFHQIKYYSPPELLVDFQAHILSPRIERATEDDPIHNTPIGNLPEISAEDPLIKQLGFSRPRGGKRTILKVYDFNPHYRTVV